MKLSDYKNNPDRFVKLFREVRKDLPDDDVDVNSGVVQASDIESLLANEPTETVDWGPLYEKAARFE